jgi:histidine ammonia-lyase
MPEVTIDGSGLTLDAMAAVARAPETRVAIAPAAEEAVRASRAAVDALLARGEVVYGITTGFGAFKDRLIAPEQEEALQRNILRSHAAGVGEPLPAAAVRAMMLVRANTLAKGYSGVQLETLSALVALLNAGVHPVVPAKGSLGASGDLAPLAHMALVLIGEGEAVYEGERLPGGEALRRAGLAPVTLAAKEGLALTNGTAMMAGVGGLATVAAENVVAVADIAGALSLEALEGSAQPFDARLHAARPHPRQIDCAAYIRRLLEGSELLRAAGGSAADPSRVQDAYSLRCIPQVHGAVRDAVAYARWALEIELNSATDNPLVFWEGKQPVALSGGNFHGELMALAMDYLALALTDLGNISERRLNRLIDERINDGLLPAFLIKHGGVNSGFMLAHVTAAALASENKTLAHPASADTIPTSANVEDHVSMGATAARQATEVLQNVETILAIELFAAAQAIDFRRERAGRALRLGRGTAPVYDRIRSQVPFLEQDAPMSPLIETVRRLVASGDLTRLAAAALGDLSGP